MGLCLLTPVFAGTKNLDLASAALVMETFVSLTGIVLLTPVFAPEEKEEVDDLVSSKYYNKAWVWLIRTACSLLAAVLLTAVFTLYLRAGGCETTPALWLGTMADAVFLGFLGLFASALCRNTVIGYMPPLLYYAVNLGMGDKLGRFYLFSMAAGGYAQKGWLFLAGIFLGAAALVMRMLRKK